MSRARYGTTISSRSTLRRDRAMRAIGRNSSMRTHWIRVLVSAATVAAIAASLMGAAAAAPAGAVQHVTLMIKADTQHAKKGPDGKWHDAYLPAAFSVKAGKKVVGTIRNLDPAPHTFTSPKLGLNVLVKAAWAGHPAVTTFTFRAPKVGTYTWTCLANCDPWAMTHFGFMKGRIVVSA